MIVVLANNHKKELFLVADTTEEVFSKLEEMNQKYPKQVKKYLNNGIKLIPANSVAIAKSKFDDFNILESNGQLGFF